MDTSKRLYVADRDAWRAWLEENHANETVVWLIYYKRHTGKARIPYDHAVEEALCFGWIDSTIKRLDDERFMQQFTPRTNHDNWSDTNIKRMRAMIEQGKVTATGMAKFDRTLLDRKPQPRPKLVLPAHVKRALMTNKKAWANFQKLALSYRRTYVSWLAGAKREETFRKRLREALHRLERNEKPGMM